MASSVIPSITSDGTTTVTGTCPRVNDTSSLLDADTTGITTAYLTTLSTQSTIPLASPTISSNVYFNSAGRIATTNVIAPVGANLTFTANNINIGASITTPIFFLGSRLYPSNLYSRWVAGYNYSKVVAGVFTGLASGATITVPTDCAFTVNDAVSPVIMLATPTVTGVTMGVNPTSTSQGNVVFTGTTNPLNCMFLGI